MEGVSFSFYGILKWNSHMWLSSGFFFLQCDPWENHIELWYVGTYDCLPWISLDAWR